MASGVYDRTDATRTYLSETLTKRWSNPEWRRKMDTLKRTPCSEKTKIKIRKANAAKNILFNKGHKPWNLGLTKNTDLCVKKMGEATSIGKKNHNWKGDRAKNGCSMITIAEYKNLFELQKGVCAICGNIETRKTIKGNTCKFTVDHNHNTDKVRGLLCHKCNVGIGLFKDDINSLKKAIKYLKTYNGDDK